MFDFILQPHIRSNDFSGQLTLLAENAAISYGPAYSNAAFLLAKEKAGDVAKELNNLKDGQKTAVILANAWVNNVAASVSEPIDRAVKAVDQRIDKYLDKVQSEGEVLPGSGLWELGLARPLEQLAEKQNKSAEIIRALIIALKQPFLCLVQSAGLDTYDAYAQVKCNLPNQFYSLHHFGLSGSVAVDSPYIDLPRYGLDVMTRRFCNVKNCGITQTVDEVRQIWESTARLCEQAII